MSNLNDATLINPSDEHIKALLSKVAYKSLIPNDLDGNGKDKNFNRLATLSLAEKNYLTDNFKVLDSIVLPNGFQACWIENTVTHEVTYSIAGTEPSFRDGGYLDYGDDVDIGTYGIAIEQFISTYNYYQEMTHNTGDTICKIVLKSTPPSGAAYIKSEEGPVNIYYTLEETVNQNVNGKSSNGANLSLAGHSLGGHLAGLMSFFTGKEATIFNAPGYHNVSLDGIAFDLKYVSETGDSTYLLSYINAFGSLLGANYGASGVTHYENQDGCSFVANLANNWPTNEINCLYDGIDPLKYHSIATICDAYYAYETLKEFTNGYEAFFTKNDLTTSKEVFDNVYKAYCLYFSNSYRELDYGNSVFIQSLTSSFKLWADSIKEQGGVLMVDSFNKTGSLALGGSGGDDIIYTGGGNDTVNTGGGNDTVYGGDFFNNAATNDYTKDIDLGSGNDKYYGGDGKDIVRSSSGENTVRLAGGDDEYIGGSGVDKVFGGSGNNEIHLGRDKTSDVYYSHVINGEVDVVWNSTKEDYIVLAGGIREQETKGNDLYIYGKNGGLIILKERGEDEEEEPNGIYGDDEDISFLQDFDIGIREIANKGKLDAESQASPLVLDLDGDGVETSGLDSEVFFDHDGNGFAENTGWVGRDDALLVRDVNGNGQIDDGTELFGNNSVLSNGAKADNGFEALKDLDSNSDGIFDNQDTAWNEVKVWKDLNYDGKLLISNF